MSLSEDIIVRLAPPTLPNNRSVRYRADEQALHLSALSADDRAIIIALYEVLGELADAAQRSDDEGPEPIRDVLSRRDPSVVLREVRRLGASAHEVRVQAAVHDIRGGAMSALFVHLDRLARTPHRTELARALFLGANDHRKMMRNVIDDLDPEMRARDLAFRPHSLADLARALREFRSDSATGVLEVDVTCRDDAVIAESCVECSALDRAAYNLLNNAARYGQPPIRAWLVKLEQDLRVVIANRVHDEHAAAVRSTLRDDEAALFGAFTTSGSGHGLRIVSDLVGRAYGIASVKMLVEEGYVGTKLFDDDFVGWFHWPLSGA